MPAIAIIGMACRYAQARSSRELWENVLAQRQAFRAIPPGRLRLEDYAVHPGESQSEDLISASMAAVLEDYEFDRARFHISKETFVSTDLTHWLALETASRAMEDARLHDSTARQRERTGVYVGNSLTGEFSRAGLMRLRWPYVRRVLTSVLERNMAGRAEELGGLLAEIESLYKSPFPPTTEDSLAGGLSNTIAGRICNYFDLKGGGYTVDGACASSLLAVATACAALESGDIDIAIAGGVDLSLDPFELAGFSKLGALAPERMRIYDAHSAGFWPGEGCGMVVLMRHEDAVADHRTPWAVVRGWGISSDGSGGITRPEVEGQTLALRRAYERAGYGIGSVRYFEGHGTGTAVGDATELQALSAVLREATPSAPAAIGSVKANIGHTKASAGVAGLIKAAMAVYARVVPPTTGCERPHPELTAERPVLRVPREGEIWPDELPARAGVSAMGFGGINVHLAVESTDTFRRKGLSAVEREQISSVQDCELFTFAAENTAQLARQMEELLPVAAEISFAEMADLAAALARDSSIADPGPVRAACVAHTPDELKRNLLRLKDRCSDAPTGSIDVTHGVFLGTGVGKPHIGYLFPGQGSPVYTTGGILARRFPAVRALYDQAALPVLQKDARGIATEIAQPCVVTASLAGLCALELLGVQADVALGHSLGEITALAWAGAIERPGLFSIVAQRGRIMADKANPSGAMASVRAGAQQVRALMNGDPLVIAAYNSPRQTVVAGDAHAVRQFTARMSSEGITTTMLPVSHAFHSPLVADVATALSGYLADARFHHLSRRIVSTVTGTALEDRTGVRELLASQITQPVRFEDAVVEAAAGADLLIEVGAGSVLAGIAAECTDKPVISMRCGEESMRGLLLAAGAAWAMGAEVRLSALFENRFLRPFDVDHRPEFLRNPCETVPGSAAPVRSIPKSDARTVPAPAAPADAATSSLDTLLNLVARRIDLPVSSIRPENRFLDDLHLNSITISQLMLEAAGSLDASAPVAPMEYTNASIAEAAQALDTLRRQGRPRASEKYPAGAGPWVRVLGVDLVVKPRRRPAASGIGSWKVEAATESDLLGQLESAFRTVPGQGLACCVPHARDENAAQFLLESVQSALRGRIGQIVFVQQNESAGALARSLFLEHPAMKVTVVGVPDGHSEAAAWAAEEARAAIGFTEAHYDRAGVRREPRLQVRWPEMSASAQSLTAGLLNEDLLLVTGGGKGIAAESALQIARRTGCRLALIGRSNPINDHDLAANLLRFDEAGIHYRYFSADIADTNVTATVLRAIEAAMGGVTALLHGAGINVPRRMDEITAADLRATLAPKLTGLRNLLSHAEGLRLLITFGSIIGRTGLHGEGHYGLANDWLRQDVEQWQAGHPRCRCLNLEWSVWAGAGMGERLGVLESLALQGITPLPLDEAIGQLMTMLNSPRSPVSSIVTGRFGDLPTLQFDRPELPLLRFLERPVVYYPGIELIAETELSGASDPYAAEHAFAGERLLPAVMAMEAMTQVAGALEDTTQLPELRRLRFDHPLIVPRDRAVTMRVAAVRGKPGVVTVAVRCSATSFQVDHFSAECVFTSDETGRRSEPPSAVMHPVDLTPDRDLYGEILFHRGRFRRVRQYRLLHANHAVAELTAPASAPWYARHLPPEFLLGDPASRDAAIHCLQACIPHRTVLPVGVDRIVVDKSWTGGAAVIHAVERLREGNDFLYDLWIQDSDGHTCERWEGLHLRAVASIERTRPWPLPLLAPYLERKLGELLPEANLRIRVARGGDEERESEVQSLLRHLVCQEAAIGHRPDGKPEIQGCGNIRQNVSLSHTAGLTLMALSDRSLGCDIEQVSGRDWQGLLGSDGLSQARMLESGSLDSAATQVWTLKESLRKAGAGGQNLQIESIPEKHWALLAAGDYAAATCCLQAEDMNLAFGFVVKKAHS